MRVITRTFDRPSVRGIAASMAFALLTAALAQVSFRLPYTPVPVTLQVLGVVLSGLFLGSKLGALAQIEYLALGLAGAPIFSGFSSGPLPFVGPTGGYMIGFVAAAFITGAIAERCNTLDFKKAFIASTAGAGVIYLFGVSWLYTWSAILGKTAPGLYPWMIGVLPFIGIDAAKCFAAATIVTGKSWRKR